VTDTMAGTITTYDTASGAAVATFKCEQQLPWATYISADGSVLGVISMRGDSVALWDMAAGKQLRLEKTMFGRPRCMALSPDGKRMAVGGTVVGIEGYAQLLDVPTGKDERLPQFAAPVSKVDFSPNGKTLAV